MKTLNKRVTITKLDKDRLNSFLSNKLKSPNPDEILNNMKIVEEKLKEEPVDATKVPSNVVTMNSKVEIRNQRLGKTFTLQLVYPQDVEVSSNKISIFSPIGANMFGYAQGDEFSLGMGNGKYTFSIEKIVYQPESAGDLHL